MFHIAAHNPRAHSLVGDGGTLQQSSSPGPSTDNGRSDKTSLNGSPGGGEHFTVLFFAEVSLLGEGEEGHDDGEEGTETQDCLMKMELMSFMLRMGCGKDGYEEHYSPTA